MNFKILGHEPKYQKRLISEIIRIKEQPNGLNLNEATELLDELYFGILKRLANISQP